ncbi:MAG: lamin tail domain-containing protein [archaeon]
MVNSSSRTILILAILGCALIAIQKSDRATAQGLPHVVINEFDPLPISGPQWAELFNPTLSSIDISHWSIVTTGYLGPQAYVLPAGVLISPQGYYVIEFPSHYGPNPSGFFLETTDSLTLRDFSVLEVDRTPLLTKTLLDERAWARFPNGRDTDSESDWKLQTATRGFANSFVGPAITCRVSPPQIEIGSTVRIFGEVAPPRMTQLIIQTIQPGAASWSNLTIVTTTLGGTYEYVSSFPPSVIGTIQVRAYLPGDAIYPSSFSSITFITITKIMTSLSATTTYPSVSLGREIATYGQLIPSMQGVNLTLTYRKPTGNPIIRYVLTDAAGFYNDTSLKPAEAGHWNVTVNWQGDATHYPTSSILQSFDVVAPAIPSLAGTEWIIGIVVGVTAGIVLLAAAITRKQGPSGPPHSTLLCPTCRSRLLYTPTTSRWYCPRCGRYL